LSFNASILVSYREINEIVNQDSNLMVVSSFYNNTKYCGCSSQSNEYIILTRYLVGVGDFKYNFKKALDMSGSHKEMSTAHIGYE